MGNRTGHDRSRTTQEQSVVDFLKRSKLAAIPPLRNAADGGTGGAQQTAERHWSQD